jgi:hypothetical protein
MAIRADSQFALKQPLCSGDLYGAAEDILAPSGATADAN